MELDRDPETGEPQCRLCGQEDATYPTWLCETCIQRIDEDLREAGIDPDDMPF